MIVFPEIKRDKTKRMEKALHTFREGKADLKTAVEMSGCSIQYFVRSANLLGLSVCRFDSNGKPALTHSEKARRINRKRKNVALDQKVKLAKELGISYGKLSAMMKAGEII